MQGGEELDKQGEQSLLMAGDPGSPLLVSDSEARQARLGNL